MRTQMSCQLLSYSPSRRSRATVFGLSNLVGNYRFACFQSKSNYPSLVAFMLAREGGGRLSSLSSHRWCLLYTRGAPSVFSSFLEAWSLKFSIKLRPESDPSLKHQKRIFPWFKLFSGRPRNWITCFFKCGFIKWDLLFKSFFISTLTVDEMSYPGNLVIFINKSLDFPINNWM